MSNFKKEHSFETRSSLASNILEKYPDRVPIILSLNDSSAKKISLKKEKYMVPKHLTLAHFLMEIRKNIIGLTEEALFLFVDNEKEILPPINATILSIYDRFKQDDGLLYLKLAIENTFG